MLTPKQSTVCIPCDKARATYIRKHGRSYSFWAMCQKHANIFAGGLGAMAAKKGHSSK